MTPRELAAAIREYVHSYNHVSFVELENRFPEYFGSGDMQMSAQRNIVIWYNLTDTAIDALEIVRADYTEIELRPSPMLVYLIDGKVPRLPIAKRPPVNGYSKPHWCPTTFSLRETGRHVA